MLLAYPIIAAGKCAAALAACTLPFIVMARCRLPCAFIALICAGGVFAGVAAAWLAWHTERFQVA